MAKVRKNPARFDYENHEIILYKWFAEKSKNPRNPEFKTLISYTTSFPTYKIVIRDDIEVNVTQEHYNGLTYEYMKWYIGKYEPKETREEVLSELESRIDISKCHSKGRRYPAIKKWFLEKYEAVKIFGMTDAEKEEFEEYKKQQVSDTPSEENQEEEIDIDAEPEFQKAS